MAETYRLLRDEHIEPEVVERLEDAGHDVIHIDTLSDLDKGASDLDLAAYSRETDRAIVTYDDDFVSDVPSTAFRAVLFFADETLSGRDVATIICSMAEYYPFEEVTGVQKTGREWL